MHLNKFTGRNIQEALENVRRELGPDALILGTREISPGALLGRFSPAQVEVTATLDPPPHLASNRPSEIFTGTGEMSAGGEGNGAARHYPPALAQEGKRLLEVGVASRYVAGLMETLAAHLSPMAGHERGGVRLVLKSLLEELLSPEQYADAGEPRVKALVGSTGVGKTTTVAKLAARALLDQGKRVALISLDNRKVAGVEPLRSYARILGLPLDLALNAEEFRELLKSHSDKDEVLVDTAGVNPRDRGMVEELRQYLSDKPFIQNYLVVAATTREEDLTGHAAGFASLPVHRLIFTKLDETLNYGCLVNGILAWQKPLDWITCGPRVPQDLKPATPPQIVNLVLGNGETGTAA